MHKATIIGGGSWGLSMATLLCYNKIAVNVWEYNQQNVEELLSTRLSEKFLPGIRIPDDILITNNLEDSLSSDTELLLFAVPSHTIRQSAKNVSRILVEKRVKLQGIVNLSKGIEEVTLQRMSEILTEELPQEYSPLIATLSGPSHAEEVARQVPTTVVLAGFDSRALAKIQAVLSNEFFRVYTSDDLVGVELGGAVKNIIAIASGIISGLRLGDNTQGALLTRGLAEIRRLGMKMGADANTFNGLSGIGDLITTAFSEHSRNRYVGLMLGKGKRLDEILSSMTMIAEGVITTKSIYNLKNRLQVDMPITDEIYQVLFAEKPPEKAIYDLMTRDLKEED